MLVARLACSLDVDVAGRGVKTRRRAARSPRRYELAAARRLAHRVLAGPLNGTVSDLDALFPLDSVFACVCADG